MKLSEKIAYLRRQQEWSQEELAERLDVSRQSVSKWESGASVPELDRIVQLCDLFDLTADELIRDSIDLGQREETSPGSLPVVTLQEAYAYTSQRQIVARKIAAGVGACVASPSVLVALSGFSGALVAIIGLPALFLMIAWAVFHFIAVTPITRRFRHIGKRNFVPGTGVTAWARQAQEQFRPSLVRGVAIGVGLCILSPSMPIAFGMIFSRLRFSIGGGAFGAGLLLAMCGAGVYMIVRSGVLQSGYRKLLKENIK